MLRFDANLYRLANLCSSDEETRPYLHGVFVEPATEGCLLVATNGHTMLVAHDAAGHCDAPAIVNLPKPLLSECKPKAKEGKRTVQINDTLATIAVDDVPRFSAPASGIFIDGTFPDWRRVVPAAGDKFDAPAAFATDYVADFARIGRELDNRRKNKGPAMQILSTEREGSHLVRWFGVEHVFGVIMPVRSFQRTDAIKAPAWLARPIAKARAA